MQEHPRDLLEGQGPRGHVLHRQLALTYQLLLWLLGRRLRCRVKGDSMRPGLRPGDEVLVNPHAYWWRPPRAGDVVLARHPWRAGVHLVKRVDHVTGGGAVFLVGDNPDTLETTDSRSFGAVPASSVVGRVELKLPD